MSRRRVLVAITAFLAYFLAVADDSEVQAGSIELDHPFSRATSAQARTGGAFVAIRNVGPWPDRLVSASSPAAERVELHVTEKDGDIMRMREVSGVDVKPGETAALAPGGTHLMMFGLKAPLTEGETFPMTLRFEKAGAIEMQVKVEKAGAGAGGHQH